MWVTTKDINRGVWKPDRLRHAYIATYNLKGGPIAQWEVFPAVGTESEGPEFKTGVRTKNALWNALVVRTTSAGGPIEQIHQC
jgi:hypothetical protein